MRQCTLCGTGLTWSAEWGHIAVVMPSPMPPCQENPWLCYTWPSLKTSLITFRLEAIAAGCRHGLSHFTRPWRILKHLRCTIFIPPLSWQMDYCCVKNNTETFKLHIPLGATSTGFFLLPFTVRKRCFWQHWNITWCKIVQPYPQFCSSSSEIFVRHSCLGCSYLAMSTDNGLVSGWVTQNLSLWLDKNVCVCSLLLEYRPWVCLSRLRGGCE